MLERLAVQRSINRTNYSTLPRHPLIICATLVQNLANLGGLCRTVEAFRLEALVLSDLKIAQTAAFKSLAASAHHWQPLLACTIEHLPDWLVQQQQAGYVIVALDANAAQPLTEFIFPTRAVLLLGQELTGIPNSIHCFCNQSVTIPQFGIVESLNVQTAASIAIYEYIRKHSNLYSNSYSNL